METQTKMCVDACTHLCARGINTHMHGETCAHKFTPHAQHLIQYVCLPSVCFLPFPIFSPNFSAKSHIGEESHVILEVHFVQVPCSYISTNQAYS